jgi:hypothetical protein
MTHVPTFTRDSEANVTIDVAVPENDPFLSGRTLPMRRSAIGTSPNHTPTNLKKNSSQSFFYLSYFFLQALTTSR